MKDQSMARNLSVLAGAVAMTLACAGATAQSLLENLTPVTDEMVQNPPAEDWLTWRRTLNHWGFSPLTDIDRRNVRNLQLVWTRALGPGTQEGTPLVHDGVMFFPNPSDFTQAFDATNGDILWEHRRAQPEDASEYFPVPNINRNLAIFGNYLFDNGTDNYAYAIDARTGELA